MGLSEDSGADTIHVGTTIGSVLSPIKPADEEVSILHPTRVDHVVISGRKMMHVSTLKEPFLTLTQDSIRLMNAKFPTIWLIDKWWYNYGIHKALNTCTTCIYGGQN